ncbi:MAG TPA: hypothetical protein VKW78_22035 [Terriglobales bacterium]|nr:hypothetical protein [Terriglobales bacterium]
MHRIRSVGVLSLAKVSGMVHAALGLLLIPFFLLMAFSMAIAGKQGNMNGNNPFAFLGPAFAIAMAVLAPVFYGLIGFITGAVGALLYNLMARWVGGIEMEVEASPTQVVV